MSFRKGGISGVRIHAAQLVYFLLMAALTAFELFTVRPEMSVFLMLFLSAVPALVLLIFFALYKYTGSSIRKS